MDGGVWSQQGGNSASDTAFSSGTAGDGQYNNAGANGRCVFRSTDDLFAHSWELREFSLEGQTAPSSMDPPNNIWDENGFENFANRTQYHSNSFSPSANTAGTVTLDEWLDPLSSLVLAEFDVNLKLLNYNDVAVQSGTKNYRYFDYVSGAWIDTIISDGTRDNTHTTSDSSVPVKLPVGEGEMTRICVFKNNDQACTGKCDAVDPATTPGCDADLITVHVEDGGCAKNNADTDIEGCDGEKGPKKRVQIGLRKILGVATTCGVSDASTHKGTGGDVTTHLSALSKDIFVWAAFDASADLTFQLTTNVHGTHDVDDVPNPTLGNGNNGDLVVDYTLTLSTPQPETHDLLFIEEPKHYTDNTLFSTHPDADSDGVTEYRVDIDDPTYDESTGDVVLTQEFELSMTCHVELQVNSGRQSHWHCFRGASGTDAPTSGVGPTSSSTVYGTDDDTHLVDGSGAANTNIVGDLNEAELSGLLTTGSHGKGACATELQVTCSDARPTARISDTRYCDIPEYAASGQEDAKEERRKDFKACVEDDWYNNVYYYFTQEVVLQGEYHAAIVQSVRLTSNRRYPISMTKNGAGSGATYVDVGTKFGASSADYNSEWYCDDANCASSDPYQVLDYNKITASIQVPGLVASTPDYNTDTWAAINTKTAGVWQTGNPEATSSTVSTTSNTYGSPAAVISTQGAWSCTKQTTAGALTGCDNAQSIGTANNGPNYNSGWVKIKEPPMGYPEAYVYGVVSFNFKDGAKTETTPKVNNPAAFTGVSQNADDKRLVVASDNQQAAHTGNGDAVAAGPHQNGAQSSATPSRRLGATSSSMVSKTLIVNALTNVIQK